MDYRFDVPALERAFAAVLRAHPATRLGFTDEGRDHPVAILGAEVPATVEVIELADESGLAEVMAADRTRRSIGAAAAGPAHRHAAAGGRDRLLSPTTCCCGTAGRALVCGTCSALRGRRCRERASFTDYLGWLARQDSRRPAGVAEALAGEPTILYPRPPAQPVPATSRPLVHRGGDPRLPTARAAGVTFNAVLSTALGLVLGHASGRAEAVFGTTVRAVHRADGIE